MSCIVYHVLFTLLSNLLFYVYTRHSERVLIKRKKQTRLEIKKFCQEGLTFGVSKEVLCPLRGKPAGVSLNSSNRCGAESGACQEKID